MDEVWDVDLWGVFVIESKMQLLIRNLAKYIVFLQDIEKKTIMAALNIQIDIPNMGVYELEELKHKVTLYAKKLAAISMKSETKDTTKQYNHESLAGIFADDWKDNDLRDEYILEKYGA